MMATNPSESICDASNDLSQKIYLDLQNRVRTTKQKLVSVFVQYVKIPLWTQVRLQKDKIQYFVRANTQLGYTDNVLAYQNQYLTPSQSPKNHYIAPTVLCKIIHLKQLN